MNVFSNRFLASFRAPRTLVETGANASGFGSKQYQLRRFAEATLGSNNLRLAVLLPEGEDACEWVAVHIVDFYNQINMIYATIADQCTADSCSVMSASPKYEYHWSDGQQYKKPVRVSAPQYITLLMDWAQKQIGNEQLFPTQAGRPFPPNFLNTTASMMFRRFLRVYAHVYHHHYATCKQRGLEALLNTAFKHFVCFAIHFNLIQAKEFAPVNEIMASLGVSASN
ncbi:MOB kinase activator 1B [Dimargaris verticillata]|uniref:MOB kinase activator 1B n=1 Tax=Dimargaris verticillata TaxID=2761393 RepID=A0A9W8EA93_9FUNG|nr:MOB kinase activator 1B [Dimargaris verticillata]